MTVDNNYCNGCPFINFESKRCPIYDEDLKKDKNGILRLKICKQENNGKFGGY